MTPETAAKIAAWRAKIASGGRLTPDEQREAVLILRADRLGAAHASAQARRTRAKAEIPSAGDLLAELNGL